MGCVIRHAACTALGIVLIIRLGWGSLLKALTPTTRPLSTSTSYMPQCEPVWTKVVPLTALIGVAPHVKTLCHDPHLRPQSCCVASRAFGHGLELGPDHGRMHLWSKGGLRREPAVTPSDHVLASH